MWVTLASTKIVFFITVAQMLSLLQKLKDSIVIIVTGSDILSLMGVKHGNLGYMGKSENWPYSNLTADILTKVLQHCSLSCPLPNISFLSKTRNFICFHGSRKAKFAKEIFKNQLLISRKGITLASTKMVFLLPLFKYFGYYDNFSFP